MPDSRISELPAASAVADANELEINEAGASKKITASQLRDFINERYFIRANVDRTLPNDTNLNAIFNSPANGRLTIPTGVYEFELMLLVTAMSTTTGNALIDIKGAGTAVIESWLWNYGAIDNSSAATVLDDDAAMLQVAATAASAAIAATGTALRFFGRGTFEVTTAGTLIPSIDLVTAAAAVVQDGTYMKINRIGAVNLVSVGPWD